MKLILNLIILFILILSSCLAPYKVHRLIDQKDNFLWTGSKESKNYILSIEQNEGKWYTGKIIIDLKDTLYLKGFEKGNNHPTRVKLAKIDSFNQGDLGHIFIWTKGLTADTVEINNTMDSILNLPFMLYLYKTKKRD